MPKAGAGAFLRAEISNGRRKTAAYRFSGGLYGYLEYLRSNALTDRLYDKLQENNHYYAMLYEYVTLGEDSGVYTDQQLRQYFADNYIKVKYIRFSTLDQSGSLLEEDELNAYLKRLNRSLKTSKAGR